ncbi:MarR family winged helix-turn-helix transcriptional regulator [Spirochaeta isovalerica]|uniref:DNA-binding MarR family transcriptional regulator n=1 Tax=Spirochaeta isovalerica TaxID=150 RepID=A0A841R9E1_9SPIO|nr:MarR family transcriptional regulator [Spirochaeta isovalerica]MBB6479082.1 DNA-binding MarR family transcriptional regulator [Spirochaeta isovalerica]
MGFYEETGILILGTRLKRLSERFLSEVGKIYEKLDISFEPAWFPLFFLLHKKGSLSVTEIADELNVSQPGASQIVSLLNRKGLVAMEADSFDRRRKIVSFTSEGEELLSELIPVWKTLESSMFELFHDGSEGFDVVRSFNQLEQKLNKFSFGDSVLDKLKM